MKRSLDLDDPEAVPYFLWNEETTVAELHAILRDRGDPTRPIYLARLMREASVPEVWKFVTPRAIMETWEEVRPHLGRRRRFWEYLLDVWERRGAV